MDVHIAKGGSGRRYASPLLSWMGRHCPCAHTQIVAAVELLMDTCGETEQTIVSKVFSWCLYYGSLCRLLPHCVWVWVCVCTCTCTCACMCMCRGTLSALQYISCAIIFSKSHTLEQNNVTSSFFCLIWNLMSWSFYSEVSLLWLAAALVYILSSTEVACVGWAMGVGSAGKWNYVFEGDTTCLL